MTTSKEVLHTQKMKLSKIVFEVEIEGKLFSAHWYPNGSDGFQGYAELDKKRKFEVSIFRGGGYKVSYYTDHRPCEKNAKEFISQYLK